MKPLPDLHAFVDNIPGRSSVFEKVPPDQRRLIDQALINHDPPTYKAVYAKFALAELGVSSTAFYYYARRLRAQAFLHGVGALVLPREANLAATLSRVLGARLFELLMDENASPRLLQRLTDAWRRIQQVCNAERRADHFYGDRTVQPAGERTGSAPSTERGPDRRRDEF